MDLLLVTYKRWTRCELISTSVLKMNGLITALCVVLCAGLAAAASKLGIL